MILLFIILLLLVLAVVALPLAIIGFAILLLYSIAFGWQQ